MKIFGHPDSSAIAHQQAPEGTKLATSTPPEADDELLAISAQHALRPINMATKSAILFMMLAIALKAAAGSASTPPTAHCAARMDAFCNNNTAGSPLAQCIAEIRAQHGSLPLKALHDTSAQHGPDEWRCYSPTCLDAGGTRYAKP